MFIIGRLLLATAVVLDWILWLYMILVVARALISWVNPDPYNPIVRFLRNATDPVLFWVRRRVPLFAGGIDFSPIIVIAAILFLQVFLVGSLSDLGQRLLY